MYSKLDLQDYNFRILTGSAEELVMDTVCASESSSTYSTTMMHDHRDHMGHMDHKDHMMTTPRIDGRFNSANFMNIESSTLVTTMLLTFLIKAFVWRVEMG